MTTPINILIIEDHLSYAQGMALLLGQHTNVTKIHIATNRSDALELLTNKSIQLIILDLHFETREYDGFTIANKVKQLYPEIKIMVLTQHARKGHHRRLFDECKVDAYLDKKLGIDETYYAIDQVMQGNIYIDKSIQSMLEIEEWMCLSAREKELVDYLSQGLLQKQIADKMHIVPKTVEVNLYNLRKKMNVKNTVELIAKYTRYKNASRENVEETTPPFKQ